MMLNLLPGVADITAHSEPGAHCKPQDEFLRYLGGCDVDLVVFIDVLAEPLIDVIVPLESEADQSQHWRNWQLKPVILLHQLCKLLRQLHLEHSRYLIQYNNSDNSNIPFPPQSQEGKELMNRQ